MSTDVSFVFRSPEVAEFFKRYAEADGERAEVLFDAWVERAEELEARDGVGSHGGSYRVAYVSNLDSRCNGALWEAFNARWSGVTLTRDNIQAIAVDWAVMYENSQRPENAEDCYRPDDIENADVVEAVLREHIGHVFDIEVD